MWIAQIAVSNANIHFDKLYSYQIPEHLHSNVHTGSIVLVPFGNGRASCRMGIVLAVSEQPQAQCQKIKSILDVAPEQPLITGELLQLVHFLKERTFCTWYDAVKTVIPYGAQYKPCFANGRYILKKQLSQQTETVYTWVSPLPEKPKPTPKQKLAEQLLLEQPQTADFLKEHNLSRAVMETLVQKGCVEKKQVEKQWKRKKKKPEEKINFELSEEQQAVFEKLIQLLDKNPHAALLHGVTASGKTIVFIKLIQQTLQQGRQVLFLVPEIGLTPQMVEKLQSVFGDAVAVQHSALNRTQRMMQWKEIKRGTVQIVVGTRSAVFAPFENIGLIIIDEEHERTYHSESSPRYSAHDIAKFRAASHKALLLLASATPSIESYFLAKTGKYQLFELNQRYSNQPLPKVELVDMRNEMQQGNPTELSNRLRREIAENLINKQQTILLLNRRGYQTVAMCNDCGEVVKCNACSVPMVYHKTKQKLMCHYCGNTISPPPQICKICNGTLRYTGFGTQKIEEELEQIFPQAKILRMDQDSTTQKDAHQKILKKFSNGEYDILIGTQMVAKGLDFPNVSLVGVLGIDQMLFSQGYRANEIVFSLITQVVGRSGRADLGGRALIQTFDTHNPILQLAAKQDYKAFYQQEIAFRQFSLYPPFCGVCMALFTGKKETQVAQAAVQFSMILSQYAAKSSDIPLRVLGPAPFAVAMINHQYRYKLTIKCKPNQAFRNLMNQVLNTYTEDKLSAQATVALDMHSDANL